jgi:cell division protein FtsI/penicillin-binding protein 2
MANKDLTNGFSDELDSARRQYRTIIFFFLLLILFLLALAGRCFYLQYLKGEYYKDICTKQQHSYYPQKPQRGAILDCRGRVLAASNRIQTVFAEPRTIKDPINTANILSPIVGLEEHQIYKLIISSKNPGYVKIKEPASSEQCSAARKVYGIGVEYGWQRYYPIGSLTSHIIGFTSSDNRGLAGIEFQYNKELSGSAGQNIFLADVHRRPIRPIRESWKVNSESPKDALRRNHEPQTTNHEPRDGVGIILTIDATIQQFARTELIKQYENYEAESAIAIVANPEDGAILAMVSLPDFDPADAHSTDPNYFRNRAISDEFEPGSIIKPIIAAIALDTGALNTQEKIFCENGNYAGRGFGRIGEYRRGFGDLTVCGILTHSSNIGMAKIGQRLGKERLYEGMKFFGFGKKTALELPAEANGLLRPVGQWTGYSITRIPFGQEISVTAIQLVRAFCILANDGRVVRPYLVKAKVDAQGALTDARPSRVGVGYIVKPEVARWIITEALTSVVNEGTGTKAKLQKWQVFGKTGTAQIARTDGKGYQEDAYIASFIAGAPAEDPRAIVLVSITRPNVKLGKGYTGGVVAAPVAASILEKTLSYLSRS